YFVFLFHNKNYFQLFSIVGRFNPGKSAHVYSVANLSCSNFSAKRFSIIGVINVFLGFCFTNGNSSKSCFIRSSLFGYLLVPSKTSFPSSKRTCSFSADS